MMKCCLNKTTAAVIVLAFCSLNVHFVDGARDKCKFDIDCRNDGQTDRCCSAYGFCGVGPDYCRTGCIFEDVELVGGDLPKRRGGGGVKSDTDDDCALLCENNGGCKWYTFDIENTICYLKATRGLSRDLDEKGKIISGSITNDGCDNEPKCEPPAKLINLQCIDASGDRGLGTGNSGGGDPTAAPAAKRTYQGALEYCHVFEAKLPYTVVTGNQLYARQSPSQYDRSYGRFKRSPSLPYQITTPYGKFDLLQGANAPDLYGHETVLKIKQRVCNLNAVEGDDDVEVFDAEAEECSARLENMIQLSDDVEIIENYQAWNLTLEEMTLLTSQDQTLVNQFPVLTSGSGLDRWHWLDTPQRNDDKCLATIPGMIGKYRMFDCNADLRVICERRGPSPFPSQPPAIFNIPKTTTLPTVPTIATAQRPSFQNIPQQPSFQAVGGQPSFQQQQPGFQLAQQPGSFQVVQQQSPAYRPMAVPSYQTNFQTGQFQPAQQQPQLPPQQTVNRIPSIYDPITPAPTMARLPNPANVPLLTDSFNDYGSNFGSFLEQAIPTRYPRVNRRPTVGQYSLPKVNPFLRQHDQLTRQRKMLLGSIYKK